MSQDGEDARAGGSAASALKPFANADSTNKPPASLWERFESSVNEAIESTGRQWKSAFGATAVPSEPGDSLLSLKSPPPLDSSRSSEDLNDDTVSPSSIATATLSPRTSNATHASSSASALQEDFASALPSRLPLLSEFAAAYSARPPLKPAELSEGLSTTSLSSSEPETEAESSFAVEGALARATFEAAVPALEVRAAAAATLLAPPPSPAPAAVAAEAEAAVLANEGLENPLLEPVSPERTEQTASFTQDVKAEQAAAPQRSSGCSPAPAAGAAPTGAASSSCNVTADVVSATPKAGPPPPLVFHQAVFDSLSGAEIATMAQRWPAALEEKDRHGNTPLLLALKRGEVEVANALVAAGARVDAKSGSSFHALDEACALGDMPLLRAVYLATQATAWQQWQERLPGLLEALCNVPDFYVEIRCEFDAAAAIAPLVRAVAPSDTYRVWKKGSWIRVDSTIANVSRRLQVRRGRTSMVLLGKDSPRPGQLMRIDHAKRKCYNALRRLEKMTAQELDRVCRRMYNNSQKKTESYDFRANNVDFSPSSSGAFRKVQRTGTICGYECRAFECSGDVEVLVVRKAANLVQNLPTDLYFDPALSLQEAAARHAAACEAAAAAAGSGGGSAESSQLGGRKGSFGSGRWGWFGGSGGGGGGSGHGHKGHAASDAAAVPATAAAAAAAGEGGSKPHKKLERRIKATLWIADSFPMQLSHVLPVIEVVAMRDDLMQRLNTVLSSAGVPRAGFPVRTVVPIALSVKAVVSFEKHSRRAEDLTDEIFELPRDYAFSKRLCRSTYAGVKPGCTLEDGWGAGKDAVTAAAAAAAAGALSDGADSDEEELP